MNNLRNKVQLIGNLGTDIDLRKQKNGQTVARVPIATREVFKNKKGERIVEVQWHNLVAWGHTAEIMQILLSKGKEVAIQGKLNQHSYRDEEGKMRHFSEVIVSEFMLLS